MTILLCPMSQNIITTFCAQCNQNFFVVSLLAISFNTVHPAGVSVTIRLQGIKVRLAYGRYRMKYIYEVIIDVSQT